MNISYMPDKKYLLIILFVILLVVLGSYWFVNRQRSQVTAPREAGAPLAAPKILTPEEIAKIIEGLTPAEEKKLTLAEKQKIEKSVTAP